MSHPDFAPLLYALWLILDAALLLSPCYTKRADTSTYRPA